ncbi:putative toxin-antitoxin system toxin component, PIN family [Bythopirellula goksoeyrii]|uniref:putative toxin-antitoxin system toxin component, PIN family n=1 Tax=Bythopirellula goksoeyrii TaxID=1400387 RepID=UPI0011CD4670
MQRLPAIADVFSRPSRPPARLGAAKKIPLVISDYGFDELRRVTSNAEFAAKYRIPSEVVDRFITRLHAFAEKLDDVPHVFDFPRDPKDAPYDDLAVAAKASLIVSRDKDLLSFRDPATTDGQDFLSRFPLLQILTPPEALKLFASPPLAEYVVPLTNDDALPNQMPNKPCVAGLLDSKGESRWFHSNR